MTREEALYLVKGYLIDIIPEENYSEVDEIMAALEQQQYCEDCVSRHMVKERMIMYGFHAPDMTVTEFVEDLPSVPPSPKIGRWIRVDDNRVKCSQCGIVYFIPEYSQSTQINYCPNCQSKMEGAEE